MCADVWVPLSRAEEDDVWERFFAELHFPMGQRPGKEPAPSITYSIAHAFNQGRTLRDTLEDDLDRKTLSALKQSVSVDGYVCALDWQHTCYRFYPHRMNDGGNWEEWKVPVLPDGDYYVFLARDLSFCIYGDCLNLTICVYGQCLLDFFQASMPSLFARVVRVDGEPVQEQ